MPQGTTKKCWLALQIVALGFSSLLAGCATSLDKKQTVHASVAENAKTLRYVDTIDEVALGSNDIFKRMLTGGDPYNLTKPVAIGVRGDTLIISDAGDLWHDRGTSISDPVTAIGKASIRENESGFGALYKYNLKTGYFENIRGAGDVIEGEISDIYIAKDMSFYVTDVDGKRVLHFSPDGDLIQEYKDAPNIFRPIAVTLDDVRQELIVADEMYSHIVAFDLKSRQPKYGMGSRGEGPGNFRIITDMIAVPGGFVISDRIELRVQIFNRSGEFIADFGRNDLMFPTALAADNFGRIYVADKADNTIKVYKAGKLIDVVGRNGGNAGEFRYISDMKVLDNKLFVVDSLNSRIQIFEFVPEAKSVALLQ